MISKISGPQIETNYNNLSECFDNAVMTYGDKGAISYNDKIYSFNDIERNINKIARYLLENGVKDNDVIGIFMKKNELFIETILAVLKVGGICLVLDSSINSERIEEIINENSVNIVICNENDVYLESDNVKILVIQDEKIKKLNNMLSFPKKNREDVAFIFYSSGTNGKPKRIFVSHGNVLNDTCFETAQPKLKSDDVFLLTSPKLSLRLTGEIFYPLFAGAKIVILEEKYSKNIDYIVESIMYNNVTVMFAVPTLLKELLSHSQINECRSIRMVQSLGEMLEKNVILKFGKMLNAELYNVYGQTEIGMCTVHQIDTKKTNTVYCGKAVPNREVYIIDECHRILDREYEGDIFVSGNYLNYDESNQENYCIIEGKKAFSTGDRGIIDIEGNLIYCGRNDNIIKLRGMKVNLNEIENICLEFYNVKNAVAVEYKSGNVQCIVIAVVFYDKKNHVRKEELFEYLHKEMPDYMMPSRIIELDDVLIGITGKENRQLVQEYVNKEFEINKSIKLDEITKLIADVLGITQNRVDASKTLMEIGINSIQFIEVLVELERILGKDLQIEILKQTKIGRICEI